MGLLLSWPSTRLFCYCKKRETCWSGILCLWTIDAFGPVRATTKNRVWRVQKIWKFCNLQFLVYNVFVKPETSIEGTLIGHVGLQTISTAFLRFGDTLLGEKKIFRTRNGFLLTNFFFAKQTKFWVVVGPFPWNDGNYLVLSSLWYSIDA